MSLPTDVSAHGHLIDAALSRSHWVDGALLAFLAGQVALVLLRRRTVARYEKGGGLAPVLFVGAVFLAIDGPLAWASLRDVEGTFANFSLAEGGARVEVNAHQWAWDFRSPGADGDFGSADDVLMWNELRVPVSTPVMLQLGSVDVVHGFNVPNLRVKVQVVPGQLARTWFEAKVAGRYEIGCSQLCGANHHRMRATLIVMEKDEYAKWAAEASRIAALAYDADDGAAHWGWSWK